MLWYGMSGQTLKKIKADILKNRFSKNYIMDKYKISDEQFELICKWKLKISYKKVNEKIAQMDKEIEILKKRPFVGQRVKCNDLEFGLGTIISLNSGNLMLVKFDSREFNTMCDYVKMITVHDDIKRKIEIV